MHPFVEARPPKVIPLQPSWFSPFVLRPEPRINFRPMPNKCKAAGFRELRSAQSLQNLYK
jgi:hypothetical protein